MDCTIDYTRAADLTARGLSLRQSVFVASAYEKLEALEYNALNLGLSIPEYRELCRIFERVAEAFRRVTGADLEATSSEPFDGEPGPMARAAMVWLQEIVRRKIGA